MASPELLQEIATVARDLYVYVYGDVTYPNDDTLLTRGGWDGYKIYDDIERDAHAGSVLEKRRIAVISREWVVDPGGENQRDDDAAVAFRQQLEAIQFDAACNSLLDATLKGFKADEILWVVEDGFIAVREIRGRDQRRFRFGQDYGLRLLTREDPTNGIPVPDRKFIVHRRPAKDGNPYGAGIGTRLFWPAWFKKQGLKFWLQFVDKFGSPAVVGTYEQGTPPEQQDKLLAAAAKLGRDAAAIKPKNMLLELLETGKATTDTHEKLCRYLDEEMSKTVLGETLTTSIDGKGSYAAGQVHNEVRLELAKFDADLLSGSINRQLAVWWTDLNYPGAKPPKVWRNFKPAADLKAEAERDRIILSLGYRPTAKRIHETYGDDYEPIPAAEAPGPAPGKQVLEPAEFAESAEPDTADFYAAQAAERVDDAMRALVDPVRAMVRGASSLDEIRDGLLGLYPHLNGGDLADLLQDAMGAAYLAGRHEAADGR